MIIIITIKLCCRHFSIRCTQHNNNKEEWERDKQWWLINDSLSKFLLIVAHYIKTDRLFITLMPHLARQRAMERKGKKEDEEKVNLVAAHILRFVCYYCRVVHTHRNNLVNYPPLNCSSWNNHCLSDQKRVNIDVVLFNLL